MIVAALIGALAIGAIAIALAVGGTGDQTVDGPETALLLGHIGEPRAPSGEIVVDVAGAVVTPGVYRLAPGARIGDAINAAGGFSPRVDADRVGRELNLAAPLSDGAQVRVPSRDDSALASGAAGGGAGTGGGPGGGQVVNLNTASESELETLPGIGPVTAGKIIESRTGVPFKTIDELRERGLVGEKTFEKIRALLSVG